MINFELQRKNMNMTSEEKSQMPIEAPNKYRRLLNVLTILSIIGNAFGIVSSVVTFFKAKTNYENLKALMEGGDIEKAPAFVRDLINQDALLLAEKMLENRIPLLITGILSAGLCLYGAIEMRKLRWHGYTYWMIGTLLYPVSMMLFVGIISFKGYALIGHFFTLLFIALYSVIVRAMVRVDTNHGENIIE